MAPVKTHFKYQGFHGCESICEVEVLPPLDGQTLVICTELPENKGTSITNFAERLATLVCRQFHIAPEKLVWIEHYNSNTRGVLHPEIFSLVTFQQAEMVTGVLFASPQWRYMRDFDWKRLGLEPRCL